ncbi:pre-mRNA-processing protein 40A-like isoform X1 [Senna tora]|uniref:Pre-mRNA-processing protein 40A-like isoform X1 n=1 Tax=Senna tora TaxID=362788 RepID=A0A834W5Z8_9FABA|nr:pre-mRNA-processing protein 40A-like isoform X1 [Senna tora]
MKRQGSQTPKGSSVTKETTGGIQTEHENFALSSFNLAAPKILVSMMANNPPFPGLQNAINAAGLQHCTRWFQLSALRLAVAMISYEYIDQQLTFFGQRPAIGFALLKFLLLRLYLSLLPSSSYSAIPGFIREGLQVLVFFVAEHVSLVFYVNLPLRPPIIGSVDPPRNFGPPMPLQFRPAVPAQQSQQFISQHYQPIGPGVPLMNVGMPSQNQQPQFAQPVQQLPSRPGQQLPLPSQAIPLPVARPNMHIPSESMMPQPDSQTPNGYAPGLGGSGIPLSSSYTYAPSSYGQVQSNFNATSQYQPVSQIQAPIVSSGEQVRISVSTASGTSLLSSGEQPPIPTVTPPATSFQPNSSKDGSTDWIEHTSANGRRYKIQMLVASLATSVC